MSKTPDKSGPECGGNSIGWTCWPWGVGGDAETSTGRPNRKGSPRGDERAGEGQGRDRAAAASAPAVGKSPGSPSSPGAAQLPAQGRNWLQEGQLWVTPAPCRLPVSPSTRLTSPCPLSLLTCLCSPFPPDRQRLCPPAGALYAQGAPSVATERLKDKSDKRLKAVCWVTDSRAAVTTARGASGPSGPW